MTPEEQELKNCVVPPDYDFSTPSWPDDDRTDEQVIRRMVLKIDAYICLFIALIYAWQYMDRTSSATAAIMGLRQEYHMQGHMYSWVGSSYALGLLAFEIPTSLAVQRYPLEKITGVMTILWGITLAASAAAKNYAGYISTRVVLGALEGVVTPAFVLMSSQWYKREEQFSRTTLWNAFSGIGQIIGSAVAYGTYIHGEHYSLDNWKVLSVVLGIITVFVGFVFIIHIPNTPADAWFLSTREKQLQFKRICGNMQGYGVPEIKWKQVVETFTDIKTYIYFFATLISNIPNGGITHYSYIMYTTMGYDTRESLLLGIASGAVMWIGPSLTMILALYIYPQYRLLFWANIMNLIEVLCVCLLSWYPTPPGKLAGLFMMNWCALINASALLSCISSNVAGSTKKSLSSAIVMIGNCVGLFIGPQLFYESEAPMYDTAKSVFSACAGAQIALYLLLCAVYWYENKKRDKKGERLADGVKPENEDLTDMENPEFRYAL